MNTVHELKADDSNKGIFLFIDSPGGEVYATTNSIWHSKTTRQRRAVRSTPIAPAWRHPADTIRLLRRQDPDETALYDRFHRVTAGTYIDISAPRMQGIKTTSISVGKNKTMGTFEGFDEQKKIYTDILMETYDQFVQVVSDGRGLTTEEVTALADGRIYSPKQALANKLADGIMTEEDAMAAMIKDCKLGDGIQYIDYSPSTNMTLSDLLGVLTAAKKTDLDSYLSAIKMPSTALPTIMKVCKGEIHDRSDSGFEQRRQYRNLG
jgi:protease-4